MLVGEMPELSINPATVFRFFTRGDGLPSWPCGLLPERRLWA